MEKISLLGLLVPVDVSVLLDADVGVGKPTVEQKLSNVCIMAGVVGVKLL